MSTMVWRTLESESPNSICNGRVENRAIGFLREARLLQPFARAQDHRGRETLCTFSEVVGKIEAESLGNRCLVAVDGCGGSGKSTFAQHLSREIGRDGTSVEVVPVDDFYRPPGSEGPEPEGLFDLSRLAQEVIEPYLASEPVSYRPFDWESENVSQTVRRVVSPSVLIIEGVFALSPLLGSRHSFGVWVEASSILRLTRGLDRDGEEAREIWTENWMPREDEYVEKQRPHERADLVVNAERPSQAGTFWCYEGALRL